MFSTYLFILIIGSQAQSFEVNTRQECIEIKTAIDSTLQNSKALKDKAATGCFYNLGINSLES